VNNKLRYRLTEVGMNVMPVEATPALYFEFVIISYDIGIKHTCEVAVTLALLSKCSRGARSNVVVKALCYKPEGRGFNTR
jgi:hypothetical protein